MRLIRKNEKWKFKRKNSDAIYYTLKMEENIVISKFRNVATPHCFELHKKQRGFKSNQKQFNEFELTYNIISELSEILRETNEIRDYQFSKEQCSDGRGKRRKLVKVKISKQ